MLKIPDFLLEKKFKKLKKKLFVLEKPKIYFFFKIFV
jgi:hypothetical protein